MILIKDFNMDPKLLRSMYDKLFIKIININVFENNATSVFKEFIKGITYFSYQEKGYTSNPIYHRLYSCGDGKNVFRNNFNTCNKTLMNKKKYMMFLKELKHVFLKD